MYRYKEQRAENLELQRCRCYRCGPVSGSGAQVVSMELSHVQEQVMDLEDVGTRDLIGSE